MSSDAIQWTRFLMTPNNDVFDLRFSNDEGDAGTGHLRPSDIENEDGEPLTMSDWAVVARSLVQDYQCDVHVDMGEDADPRFVVFKYGE